MQLSIIDIIFLAVVVAQLAIAMIAAVNFRGVDKRYAHPTGSKTTMVDLLQKYSRIYSAINIKVDANIRTPAKAHGDTLLVNRKIVYSTLLFPNFIALYQIVLLQPSYALLRKARAVQIVLFILELVLFGIRLYSTLLPGVVALCIAVVLLITSFFYQSFLGDVLKETYDVAADLLDLDEVERGRTLKLIREVESQAFVYAIDPVMWLVRFVIPFK